PNSNINKLINSLENQVGTIIVVDNGSSQKDILNDNLSPSLEIIELPTNLGIAAAQNIGIVKGLAKKTDYFVFFDQDSQIENNMIASLHESFEEITKTAKLAAVGPVFYDPDYN
ncbi:glycosyltransferase, partial [Enterobacter hormaechei]|nr:glycosyltransferase [Enterobacter hormaechei]